MPKKNGKNPYYHPDPKNNMLNQIGDYDDDGNIIDDGYSFDEYDDEQDDDFENETSGDMKYYNYNDTEVYFKISSYQSDPMVMAIQSYTKDDHEPYSTLSVNLGSYVGNDLYSGSFIRNNCTFIDTNNNPGAEEFLESIGAKPYVKFGQPVTARSGFCEYPLYEFPESLLRDMDKEGSRQHFDDYAEELPNAQQKLWSMTFGSESGFEDLTDEDDFE